MVAVALIQAALFDIDGTLTQGGPVWTPLLKASEVPRQRLAWVYGTGLPHRLLSKTSLASQAGFRDRWVRLMAWLMGGWSQAQVQAMCERIAHEMLIPDLRQEVVAILRDHLHQGRVVVLISTMPHLIVEHLASVLGAHAGLGSVLEFDRDRATGRIVGAPCAGARKVDVARRYLAEQGSGIALSACAAYADSGSDIPLLQAVGYPTAVYPDAVMRAAAERGGWAIFPGAG